MLHDVCQCNLCCLKGQHRDLITLIDLAKTEVVTCQSIVSQTIPPAESFVSCFCFEKMMILYFSCLYSYKIFVLWEKFEQIYCSEVTIKQILSILISTKYTNWWFSRRSSKIQSCPLAQLIVIPSIGKWQHQFWSDQSVLRDWIFKVNFLYKSLGKVMKYVPIFDETLHERIGFTFL